jgi:AcrR family transcriptional regulator
VTDELRGRVLDATFAEVAENGLGGLTVEAVATRAGSSRATIYRHFPGGRDELVLTTVRREVRRFFDALAASVSRTGSLDERVTDLVIGARRLLVEHEVLQRLLEDEAEAIVPSLATVHPMIQAALADHLGSEFRAADVEPGIDPARAADHCARMVLSYVGAGGSWNLDDPDEVRTMVRTRILAGVV